MAHEISHVALRHSTNQASKAMLAQAPLAVLGGIFSGGGIGGQIAQLGVGFGLQSAFLKFSRSAERQADEQGAQMLYDAGYEPKAMADFFATLQASSGGGGVEFFSSHPNPGNRQRDVAALIPRLGPSKNFTTGADEFYRMKRRNEGLAESSSPAQPARDAEPPPRPGAPSRRMTQFRSEWFRIGYPDNWQVHGEGSSTVTLVPPEGIVRSGETAPPALAYGALISVFEPYREPGRRLTLSSATNQLIRELQRSNPNLQVTTSARRFRGPDRVEMIRVMAKGNSPLPQESEANWIVTTFRPEGLWYVVFIAPESDYGDWESTFQHMLDSVRFP